MVLTRTATSTRSLSFAAPTRAVLAQTVVRARARGSREAPRFAAEHAAGARAWAIEGAGHYGPGLTRYLEERDETVLEVGRQPRNERRFARQGQPSAASRLVVPRDAS
jgi:hypothetical protein